MNCSAYAMPANERASQSRQRMLATTFQRTPRKALALPAAGEFFCPRQNLKKEAGLIVGGKDMSAVFPHVDGYAIVFAAHEAFHFPEAHIERVCERTSRTGASVPQSQLALLGKTA